MALSTSARSTTARFGAIAMIVLGALVISAAVIGPDPDNQPVIVNHDRGSATVSPLTSESAAARADLDRPMTDEEISARSVAAVAAVTPAVVTVYRTSDDGSTSAIGSGVAVEPEGWIIASLSTTGTDGDLTVTWADGLTSSARIARIDEEYGLVLLTTNEEPPALASIAPYASRSGDRVLAVGSPLEDFSSTATSGMIGAIGVDRPETDELRAMNGLIQHDAAINPGNEGGPIIDLNGNVVGINVGSIVRQGDEFIQGWSFAVPVTLLGPLLALDR